MRKFEAVVCQIKDMEFTDIPSILSMVSPQIWGINQARV